MAGQRLQAPRRRGEAIQVCYLRARSKPGTVEMPLRRCAPLQSAPAAAGTAAAPAAAALVRECGLRSAGEAAAMARRAARTPERRLQSSSMALRRRERGRARTGARRRADAPAATHSCGRARGHSLGGVHARRGGCHSCGADAAIAQRGCDAAPLAPLQQARSECSSLLRARRSPARRYCQLYARCGALGRRQAPPAVSAYEKNTASCCGARGLVWLLQTLRRPLLLTLRLCDAPGLRPGVGRERRSRRRRSGSRRYPWLPAIYSVIDKSAHYTTNQHRALFNAEAEEGTPGRPAPWR